jgi:hypothetical protein
MSIKRRSGVRAIWSAKAHGAEKHPQQVAGGGYRAKSGKQGTDSL